MNRDSIDEILDEFDFERVHKVMMALNWQWHNIDGVPTIGDLRRRARDLLKTVSQGEHVLVGSGGFFAYREWTALGLRFEVASYETECR